METYKKNRRVLRTVFTKCANELQSLLSAEPKQYELIETEWEMLQQKYSALSVVDEQIYNELLEKDESEENLASEMESTDGYVKRYTTLRLQWGKIAQQQDDAISRNNRNSDAVSDASSVNEQGKRSFRLPTIEFKKFSGDIRCWLSFWAQFKKIHEDQHIDQHDKIAYLVQATVPGSRARQLVQSFPAVPENYSKIIDSLTSRFGREDLQIEVYIREFLKLILNNSAAHKMDISTLYDRIETQLRALETLGITKNNCAAMLFPLIESCLPEHLLRAWQRSSGFNNSTGAEATPLCNRLNSLMTFLKSEVESEQRILLAAENFGLHSPAAGMSNDGSRRYKHKQFDVKTPTAAGLINLEIKCCFCDGAHLSESCLKVQKYSLDQKIKALTSQKACFRCLKRGHQSRLCRGHQRCLVCTKSHVTLMCPDLPSHKNNTQLEDRETIKSKPVEQALSSHTNTRVFLQTLSVDISNGPKHRKIRVLIDSGSQRSYILNKTAQELGYDALRTENLIHSLFGGHCTSEKKHNCYKIKLHKNDYTCTFDVLDQPQICNEIQPVVYGSWVEELKSLNIELSDSFESGPIEVLVGADIAGKLYTGRRHVLSCGLVAMETSLGWTIMGKLPYEDKDPSLAMTTLAMFAKDAPITDLWKLDVLGITEPTERKSRDDMATAAKEMFLQTVSTDLDGRYKVNLPWLEGHPPIPSYFSIAKRRLETTLSKLEKQNSVDEYDQIFQEWLLDGVIELVPKEQLQSPAHYLAHRPVFKDSGTTKIRPVFDASASEKGKPSLNSCLEVGPNLIESIPSILLRFRFSRLGVVSDIKRAFLQISLDKSDRDFLRFLWIGPDKRDVVYRHKRVVFGVNCSPFLLGATIEYHLQLCKQKCLDSTTSQYTLETIGKLEKSFYVDNCISSVSDEKALTQFINESVIILGDAKMDLRGWEYTGKLDQSNDVAVLGLTWLSVPDVLKINQNFIEKNYEEKDDIITKRIMLSRAQRIFDPIGFTCPATLCPKILLQQTFEKELSWDAPVDSEIEFSFRSWEKELPFLLKIIIPRWIQAGPGEAQHLSLHTFCDASKHAYAVVIFLRVEVDSQVQLYLLGAKSRVAPLKNKLTIPRLELLAATIASRLCASVKADFDNIETYYWSDSSTVISWIKRTEEWATFVGNRIKEIRSLTEAEAWRHVPGNLNPADLPSRGCSPKHLYESQWWEGPSWLCSPPSEWPQEQFEYNEVEIIQERKKRVVTSMINGNMYFWHLNYFHKYNKTLRMVAWIFRFINNVKSKQRSCEALTADEIIGAEKFVLKVIQTESYPDRKNESLSSLNVFEDEDGLIRLRTQVSNRKDIEDFCYPVVLPGRHSLVKLLIINVHENSLHVRTQGLLSLLREKYWITGGRRAVRAAISSCVKCKRQSVRPFYVPAPPLPLDRVRDAVPFEVTGIDFAGPLYLNNGEKIWICLFTCAVYRAVHLELATSMSTVCFTQALRRFVARYGRPTTIYTDNGTNFVGAENALAKLEWNSIQDYAASQRIKWRFNPPTASWWGGFWERLIGILKGFLRKALGKSSLSYEDLLTLVCECEDIINSRPITYISSDPSDLTALTPSMFLRDCRHFGLPDCDAIDRASLCRKVRYRQKLRDDLRQRFRSEYLGQLERAHKIRTFDRDVKIGEIVLVGNDVDKRFDWPLARVTELLPNRDGKTRLVRVLTHKGQLLRPVQRLYPLECSDVDLPEARLLPERQPTPVPITEVPVPDGQATDLTYDHDEEDQHHQCSDKTGVKSRVNGSGVKLTRSGRVSKLPVKYL